MSGEFGGPTPKDLGIGENGEKKFNTADTGRRWGGVRKSPEGKFIASFVAGDEGAAFLADEKDGHFIGSTGEGTSREFSTQAEAEAAIEADSERINKLERESMMRKKRK